MPNRAKKRPKKPCAYAQTHKIHFEKFDHTHTHINLPLFDIDFYKSLNWYTEFNLSWSFSKQKTRTVTLSDHVLQTVEKIENLFYRYMVLKSRHMERNRAKKFLCQSVTYYAMLMNKANRDEKNQQQQQRNETKSSLTNWFRTNTIWIHWAFNNNNNNTAFTNIVNRML